MASYVFFTGEIHKVARCISKKIDCEARRLLGTTFLRIYVLLRSFKLGYIKALSNASNRLMLRWGWLGELETRLVGEDVNIVSEGDDWKRRVSVRLG
jgi:hypothetical protein